ncbi:hypothetical protein L873DRAFT_808557 [Choiromyces venosus 120613-1]|uniref:Uncharacterized protein n=1 Tax=Choiromyces venosus 120613-1 TaxID=1336337 RepID=A0A3N4JTJ8_9PEZI|nr:hypothetical protein L873DRAFT_808557 [Choiromyces venosus 120613-1]
MTDSKREGEKKMVCTVLGVGEKSAELLAVFTTVVNTAKSSPDLPFTPNTPTTYSVRKPKHAPVFVCSLRFKIGSIQHSRKMEKPLHDSKSLRDTRSGFLIASSHLIEMILTVEKALFLQVNIKQCNIISRTSDFDHVSSMVTACWIARTPTADRNRALREILALIQLHLGSDSGAHFGLLALLPAYDSVIPDAESLPCPKKIIQI